MDAEPLPLLGVLCGFHLISQNALTKLEVASSDFRLMHQLQVSYPPKRDLSSRLQLLRDLQLA